MQVPFRCHGGRALYAQSALRWCSRSPRRGRLLIPGEGVYRDNENCDGRCRFFNVHTGYTEKREAAWVHYRIRYMYRRSSPRRTTDQGRDQRTAPIGQLHLQRQVHSKGRDHIRLSPDGRHDVRRERLWRAGGLLEKGSAGPWFSRCW